MTKHILIQYDDNTRFIEDLNNASKENNVFATQTHVTEVAGRLWYTAVCFVREDK